MTDDLLNYQPKPNLNKEPNKMDKDITLDKERSAASPGGGKISTIFLIVLGLHILVIIGISAYHLVKGGSKTPDVAKTSEEVQAALPDAATVASTETPASIEGSIPSNAAQAGTPVVPDVKIHPGAAVGPNDPVWGITANGNTPVTTEGTTSTTVASVPPVQPPIAAVQPPVASGKGGEYTVAKGDTLSKIARKTGVSVSAIKQANSLSNDFLKIGQKLNLPEGAKTVASAPAAVKSTAPAASVATAPAAGYGTYEVAKGDTLAKIARTYGTTPDKIAKMNAISDPKKLKIGMKLKVPGQSPATTATAEPTPDTAAKNPVTTAPSTSVKTDLVMLREGEKQ